MYNGRLHEGAEKEQKGVAAEVLMATPCTDSLGGEREGHRQEGCEGRRLCWRFACTNSLGGEREGHR